MLLGSKEVENDDEKLRDVEEYLGADEKLKGCLPKEGEVDGALVVVRSRVIVGCEFKVEIEELGIIL